jgi:hypothetical protein
VEGPAIKEYNISRACNRSMAAKFGVQQYEFGALVVDNGV